MASRDPGRVRGGRPRAVGGHRARPGQADRRRRPRPVRRSSPPTKASANAWARPRPTWTATCPRTAGTSSAAPSTARRRSPTSPRSSASPRCCRSTPAASASSRVTTSRRPATSASRSWASACSTATATSSSRCRARAGSRRPTRSWIPTDCRSLLLREADGTRATISISMPEGPDLIARIWVASVGRVPLLMLDTDVEGNPDHYIEITDRLYGGNSEHRLRQELLLGVGGVRALRAYSRITGSPEPEVFHTNEGHAGFLGIERIRELTAAEGGPQLDLDTALEVGRASTVFTTHTPVPAGIDRFPRTLVEQYFAAEGGATPGVPVERILALGTEDYEGGDPEVFNMAVMGFRLAQRANGVSQLHGEVSRGMFNGLWPAFDEAEVPIGSITNGVHAPTWVAREIFDLATSHGADADSDDTEGYWAAVDKVSGVDVWAVKRQLRERLVVGRPQAADPVVGEARRRQGGAGLDRHGTRPRRADHRLRAEGAVVQAADADAQRQGAAQGTAPAPRASGAAGDRGQVAPGRRRWQEADPGDGALRRRSRGPPPDRVPAQLRHRDGPAALPRLRRLAEQPAAPLRGLRHLRHEGGAQRRPQPLDPRRLVGRVVRRRQRLGDPVRRRRRRPRQARRPRGRPPSTS